MFKDSDATCAITETDYDTLNDKARELIGSLVARINRKAAA